MLIRKEINISDLKGIESSLISPVAPLHNPKNGKPTYDKLFQILPRWFRALKEFDSLSVDLITATQHLTPSIKFFSQLILVPMCLERLHTNSHKLERLNKKITHVLEKLEPYGNQQDITQKELQEILMPFKKDMSDSDYKALACDILNLKTALISKGYEQEETDLTVKMNWTSAIGVGINLVNNLCGLLKHNPLIIMTQASQLLNVISATANIVLASIRHTHGKKRDVEIKKYLETVHKFYTDNHGPKNQEMGAIYIDYLEHLIDCNKAHNTDYGVHKLLEGSFSAGAIIVSIIALHGTVPIIPVGLATSSALIGFIAEIKDASLKHHEGRFRGTNLLFEDPTYYQKNLLQGQQDLAKSNLAIMANQVDTLEDLEKCLLSRRYLLVEKEYLPPTDEKKLRSEYLKMRFQLSEHRFSKMLHYYGVHDQEILQDDDCFEKILTFLKENTSLCLDSRGIMSTYYMQVKFILDVLGIDSLQGLYPYFFDNTYDCDNRILKKDFKEAFISEIEKKHGAFTSPIPAENAKEFEKMMENDPSMMLYLMKKIRPQIQSCYKAATWHNIIKLKAQEMIAVSE